MQVAPVFNQVSLSGVAIDTTVAYEAFLLQAQGCGAVVTFSGLLRDENLGSSVNAMHLEHYPEMTLAALQLLANKAQTQFDCKALQLIHRVGLVKPNETLVWLAIASTHRAASFAAAQFVMDKLKTDVPLWKKEFTLDGERWVESRASDYAAAAKWHNTTTEQKIS